MSASFFSKWVGAACDRKIDVEVHDHPALRPFVALDPAADKDSPSAYLTPTQAKELGRALIKAAKYIEKTATPIKLCGFTAKSSGMAGGDNEHALGSR